MAKILRIDLKRRSHCIEEERPGHARLGGRGLTSLIVGEEVPALCDPLGPDNKLVLAGGICAGTSVPNSGRLSIGAKSPLTGTIKESNSGGSAAQKMARLGFKAVVIEGVADALTIAKIDRNGVSFHDAGEFKGCGNYRLVEELSGKFGSDSCIVSIGPAGEMGLKASAVSVTSPDLHLRFAARGGLGAVMGAKRLKALVIDDAGCSPVQVRDQAKLGAAVKAFTQGVLSHPLTGGLRAFGTPLLVNMINEMGGIVTKNYSRGRFEGAEKISGEHIASLTGKRPNASSSHKCMPGCVISCSNIFTDAAGEFVVSSIEYETLALMGSNCMIDDIEVIARMNRACNDIGVDTMDVGGAVAVAMEAGLLAWGDGAAALALIEEVGTGSARGKMIGNGVKVTGDTLGVVRIPHVKGQCLSGYDPRRLKGTGVTYATSTMGADHTCGNALPSPANPGYDPAAASGQGAVSRFLQQYMAAVDSLGLCLFCAVPALDLPELQAHLVSFVEAIYGESLPEDYLLQLGASALAVENRFNAAAGFTRQDDRLPSFFTSQPLPETGHSFDVAEAELDSVN